MIHIKTKNDICNRIVELDKKLKIIRQSIIDSENTPDSYFNQEDKKNALHYFQGELTSLYWMLEQN